MKTVLYYSGIALIVILSFLCYSSNFYALLSSDDAIQVLMIHYFQLPHDLYFWGQDRYGSLIPLIGQLFHQGLGISALTSESITHSLILIAGFFSLATFFKTKSSRMILAIVWFLPPFHMVDFLRGNIGLEYSLLAIGIFLLNKLRENAFHKNKIKQHTLLLSITLLFILATWVSDLAAISVVLILLLQIYFEKLVNKNQDNSAFNWKPAIYYLAAGILTGSALILYGKINAVKSPMYNSFNDLSTTADSIKIFVGSVSDLLRFKSNEPFTSVYFYLVILFSGTLFAFREKIRIDKNQKKWFLFFVLDCVLIFGMIMISKWSYTNGVPRRYFTSNYITFWMALLLAFEHLAETNIKKMLRIALMISVLVAGGGCIFNMKYIWPKSLKPRAEYVREFESLGRIGIIGNYWNSYINSVTRPEQIIATPDDRSSVRNLEMAYEVMKRDTFYIIRDSWMETFPDSLNQFGTQLYKNGEEFRMGDCFVCRYRK
jgi:hypothetical protein